MVRVQRVVMPSGVESATVLRDGSVVEPVERFLAHLTAIERSPNTVKAYAHDLRDFFAFLDRPWAEWDRVVAGGSRPVRRLAAAAGGGPRAGGSRMLPWVDADLLRRR